MNLLLPGKGRPHDETKRISRVLEIIQMITINPHKYRRADLSERFEISERMIQKDFDLVRHGLKLKLLRGEGGYYFETVPKMPAITYTASEALSLMLSAKAAVAAGGIDTGALSSALARLEAIFPLEFVPVLHKVLPRPRRLEKSSMISDKLLLLHTALMKSRKVEMKYKTLYRKGEPKWRKVHPCCVLPYQRSWHLIAFCEMRKRVRTFKLDRILDAKITSEAYLFPDGFSPESFMANTWGILHREKGHPEAVVLKFDARAGTWVNEDVRHPTREIEVLPDGKILFKVTVDLSPDFIGWILSNGDHVEVIEPERLRREVAEAHRRAAERYLKIKNP